MPSNTRIGHVMRGIQRAFITEPDRAWSTSELRQWTHAFAAYQGRNSHRERIITAATFAAPASVCVSPLAGPRLVTAGQFCGAAATASLNMNDIARLPACQRPNIS
jgi:hypothetical protein